MVDENLLKQLENSLILYQENQETLNVVVQNAQNIFGDTWMNELPNAFDNIEQMDATNKSLLKDKANHVVHYYGALAAWQEASAYLSDPSVTTAQILSERLPVLEYWLNLFGNEGKALVARIRDLYQQLSAQSADTPELVEDVDNSSQVQEVELPQAQEVQEDVQNAAAQEIAQATEEEILNEAPKEEPLVVEETQKETADLQVETTVEVSEVPAQEVLPQEEQAETQKAVTEEISAQPEALPEEQALQDENAQTPVVLLQEETTTAPIEENAIEITEEKQEAPQENVPEQPAWEDTLQETSLDDLIDPQSISQEGMQARHEFEERFAPKEEDYTPSNTQNWDIANFLRQKRLYDDANNWLSAWCIRMDNAEKTSYPHYGFIVDIMHDLKEKALNVLENQLLDELVEREIVDGRVGLERVVEAIDKELEDLPDDFKISTAEKIKLSAREVLGAMDTSTEKEFIGPAPDGFELMDDPYAASAEQIINDFEKTEKEVQNQIDKLNVMEDNTNNSTTEGTTE